MTNELKQIEQITGIEVPEWLFGYQPKIEVKDGGTHICPNCKGKVITKESEEGFEVCGLCKGHGSAECEDRGYHETRWGPFCITRSWTDVTRIIAKDREPDPKLEEGFKKVAHYSGTKWLGYSYPWMHIVQNDVNFGRD